MRKIKKTAKKNMPQYLIAGAITLILLGVIVYAGPASAITFSLSGIKDKYAVNEDASFGAILDLQSNEKLAVNTVTLYLDGAPLCTFDNAGKPISGNSCDAVQLAASPTQGFGYGYGIDSSYQVMIKHNLLKLGQHTLKMSVNSDSGTYSSDSKTITILPPGQIKNGQSSPVASGSNGKILPPGQLKKH